MEEYIVVARSEVGMNTLHTDLLEHSSKQKFGIPIRSVAVANPRLTNPIVTHYFLTEAEAHALAADPRASAVHRPPHPDAKKKSIVQQSVSYNGVTGNFHRNAASDKYNINWGLRRTSLTVAESTTGNNYNYDVNGTGVDIIVMDDGIQDNHPEFLDATGVSRVQKIDWYATTGIAGTMPPNHYKIQNYGDGEHGTHVASTIAGNTFGYAKNSRIYLIRIFGNASQTIPDYDMFDLIRVWHTKKPVNPVTKIKRPTIVNMSWGYVWYYHNDPYSSTPVMTSNTYRGTTHRYNSPSQPLAQYGQKIEPGAKHGLLVPSVDAEQQLAENAGVVFVRAAGNYGNKIDLSGGTDYNNSYTINQTFGGMIPPGQPIYYHRGGSPRSSHAVVVSAARDITAYTSGKTMEVVDNYSERGPGCHVVSPGTNITAATSKMSSYTPYNEYVWGKNTTNDRSHLVTKISGTSMATPQVTGVLSLFLSMNPKATVSQVKTWVATVGKKNQIASSLINNDWNAPNALLGGANNYLYNPYHNGYTDNLKF